MRFNSTPEPDTPVPTPAPVAGKPSRKASALVKAFRAVPDATLHFLLDAPADFDAARVRKDFLAWAEKHGRMDDSDWRPAWSSFVQSQKETAPPVRPAPRLVKKPDGGFKTTTTTHEKVEPIPTLSPQPFGPVRHPWEERRHLRLVAAWRAAGTTAA